MLLSTLRSGEARYIQISQTSNNSITAEPQLGKDLTESTNGRFGAQTFILFFCWALFFTGLGLLLGHHTTWITRMGESLVATEFTYHEIYTEPPSARTNAAWLSLFPRGHGFVQVPGSSQLSLLSVYHQLHCVNVIRHGYYVALNGSYLEESLKDLSISRESVKHEHIVHCFDYLRQSIECFSDQTFEAVDILRGGAEAWNTVHQCHDHSQTMELAAKLEVHKKKESEKYK